MTEEGYIGSKPKQTMPKNLIVGMTSHNNSVKIFFFKNFSKNFLDIIPQINKNGVKRT